MILSNKNLLTTESIYMTQSIDLTEQVFGKLQVLSRATSTKRGSARFLIRCECGTEKLVLSRSLLRGATTSCGCQWKARLKRGRPAKLDPKQVGKNRLYARYVQSAKKRGYEWGLSRDEFETRITGNCYYCGTPPSSRSIRHENHGQSNLDLFEANGIDRKNNNQGYIPENSVSCCRFCQYGKRDAPYEEFVQYLKRVAVSQNLSFL
jgi:hypothetical protein